MSARCFQNRPSKRIDFDRPHQSSIRRITAANALALVLALTVAAERTRAQGAASDQNPGETLKQLSLAQLGDIEVTTVSKDPRQVQKTPAAVFVITQEDIR